MKSKKTYIIIILAVIFIGGALFWSIKNPKKANAPVVENSQQSDSDIIYFYGAACSHCKEVSKFLEDNNIADKINFEKKEVWSSKENATEMQKKAGECGIAPSGMGVPFLYANGKCFVGTPDVEGFFKQAAGIQ